MTAREALPQLRVVTVGHVDHGKSTLIGRLLHDTGNLPDGKVAELLRASERRGVAFEWSFVLDALQSERDQAITIDTTRIWLRLAELEIVLIDAPGHEEFLRNMVTGASDADAALLVVDAAEGVGEQTRRHALLLELIGVRQVVVAVNKMDRVGYDERRFTKIRDELGALLGNIGIVPRAVVPLAARDGDNVAIVATTTPWYAGPTIVTALCALTPAVRQDGAAFRLAVQGVIRRDLERIVVGRIEAGSVRVGDEIVLSPGDRRARVRTLESWPANGRTEARAGESIGLTVEAPLFVERGDVVSDTASAPAAASRFRARLLWLGRRELRAGTRLRMRIGTRLAHVEVEAFERVVDIATLKDGASEFARTNDVAEIILRSRELLALDTVAAHAGLGRFILIDGLDVAAGGVVLAALPQASDVVPVGHLLGRDARAWRNGHRGAVLWLTGLPAAGKSTLAMALERRLFERGVQCYVLDGDNVRTGLCRDLGFTDDDRSENVRRVGEVAALFADAGLVAIAAFISPYRADREEARRAAGIGFHEVYVKADSALCEARDPKGHYAKARAGALSGFTGLTGEYEVPLAPELVVDTATLSIDEAVALVLDYVTEQIAFERDRAISI
jgi:bifunctional enzyme CysN/CysC